ncbi:hypothetical protein TNCV_2418341 [Trichonephila clavipes]|nr:hypothetical protein TNCV_2418341 [Trichonephila clavipes]
MATVTTQNPKGMQDRANVIVEWAVLHYCTFSMQVLSTQRYRDEILKAYVKFFWVLWVLTTFLGTVMSGHTELTLLMNFIKERIFTVWIDPRDLQITILLNRVEMV